MKYHKCLAFMIAAAMTVQSVSVYASGVAPAGNTDAADPIEKIYTAIRTVNDANSSVDKNIKKAESIRDSARAEISGKLETIDHAAAALEKAAKAASAAAKDANEARKTAESKGLAAEEKKAAAEKAAEYASDAAEAAKEAQSAYGSAEAAYQEAFRSYEDARAAVDALIDQTEKEKAQAEKAYETAQKELDGIRDAFKTAEKEWNAAENAAKTAAENASAAEEAARAAAAYLEAAELAADEARNAIANETAGMDYDDIAVNYHVAVHWSDFLGEEEAFNIVEYYEREAAEKQEAFDAAEDLLEDALKEKERVDHTQDLILEEADKAYADARKGLYNASLEESSAHTAAKQEKIRLNAAEYQIGKILETIEDLEKLLDLDENKTLAEAENAVKLAQAEEAQKQAERDSASEKYENAQNEFEQAAKALKQVRDAKNALSDVQEDYDEAFYRYREYTAAWNSYVMDVNNGYAGTSYKNMMRWQQIRYGYNFFTWSYEETKNDIVRKYQEAKAKLDNTKALIAGYDAAAEWADRAKADLAAAETALAEAETALENASDGSVKANQAYYDALSEVMKTKSQLKEAREELEEQRNIYRDAAEKKEIADSRSEEAKRKYDSFAVLVAEYQITVDAANAEKAKVQAAFDTAQAQYDAANEELNKAKEQVKSAEAFLKTAQENFDKVNAAIAADERTNTESAKAAAKDAEIAAQEAETAKETAKRKAEEAKKAYDSAAAAYQKAQEAFERVKVSERSVDPELLSKEYAGVQEEAAKTEAAGKLLDAAAEKAENAARAAEKARKAVQDADFCTLTFHANGGSAVGSVSGACGTAVDLGRYVPVREGYVFGGWYADKALNDRVSEIRLTGDRSVYAKWLAFPFTDVTPSDWSCEDVAYVLEKGLMNGVSETGFAPKRTVSRAMIVTVLWRLEGEPTVNYAMSFTDVASERWYTEAIRWAQADGIVNGYSLAQFGPGDPVTREQMAAILYRYAQYRGYDVSAEESISCHDFRNISEYAVPAMIWAVGNGLLQGSDCRLTPQGCATREQLAAVLHRFCENIVKERPE